MDEKADIKAIITTDKNLVLQSGVPVFWAGTPDSLQQLSQSLERTLDASAHEISRDTVIIVSR